jgi:hypothetical protein
MRRLDTRRSRSVEKVQNRGGLHTAAQLLQPRQSSCPHPGICPRVGKTRTWKCRRRPKTGWASGDLFVEKISAVNAHRPQFNLMMKMLEPGDTLVVYAFNRLCRNLKGLADVVDEMKAMGVTLVSTTQNRTLIPTRTNGRLLIKRDRRSR